MVAPGGGAGNQAAATAMVSKAFDVLKAVFQGFPNGSKEQQAVMRAMTALNPLFGTDKAAELSGAAGRQLSAMGAPGNPLAGTPSPGIQSAPMPPPAGAAGPAGPGAM
jgi:hypothetical protein